MTNFCFKWKKDDPLEGGLSHLRVLEQVNQIRSSINKLVFNCFFFTEQYTVALQKDARSTNCAIRNICYHNCICTPKKENSFQSCTLKLRSNLKAICPKPMVLKQFSASEACAANILKSPPILHN